MVELLHLDMVWFWEWWCFCWIWSVDLTLHIYTHIANNFRFFFVKSRFNLNPNGIDSDSMVNSGKSAQTKVMPYCVNARGNWCRWKKWGMTVQWNWKRLYNHHNVQAQKSPFSSSSFPLFLSFSLFCVFPFVSPPWQCPGRSRKPKKYKIKMKH